METFNIEVLKQKKKKIWIFAATILQTLANTVSCNISTKSRHFKESTIVLKEGEAA